MAFRLETAPNGLPVFMVTEGVSYYYPVVSSFTALGDSGSETHRLFCGNCSTVLGLKCDGFDLYSLAASTIEGGDRLRPNMLIYTKFAPAWTIFPEGLPKYDILPPG